MPCFLLFIVLLFPRVTLLLLWLFSSYLQRAFHGGLLLPVLGFFFLPLTTFVYAWEYQQRRCRPAGINLVWLLIAVIIDLGGLGRRRASPIAAVKTINSERGGSK